MDYLGYFTFEVYVVCAVCPLNFTEPSEVIKACRNVAAPSPSCCSSLNTYISGIQNQMLITNKQAIICSTVFGSILRKGGVMTNVYELCDIDLKDFSIQGLISCYDVILVIFFVSLFCLILRMFCGFVWIDAGAAYGQQGTHFFSSLSLSEQWKLEHVYPYCS